MFPGNLKLHLQHFNLYSLYTSVSLNLMFCLQLQFLSAYLTRLTRTKHAELSDEHWSLLFKEVVQR